MIQYVYGCLYSHMFPAIFLLLSFSTSVSFTECQYSVCSNVFNNLLNALKHQPTLLFIPK